MDSLAISPGLLGVLFFVVAFLYSSVGLAGGSSYIALLTIFGASYQVIPPIALAMNILVSSLGSFNYIRGGHARWPLIVPFVLASVPMAFVGGSTILSAATFYWLLLFFLAVVALRIYFFPNVRVRWNLSASGQLYLSLLCGALLGFVSGALGIGGGIYLIPLILLFGLGDEKQAAACGSIFILTNSLAGLSARTLVVSVDFADMLPLVAGVALGGYLGSFFGSTRFSKAFMQKCLGLIVVVAMGFILRRLWAAFM